MVGRTQIQETVLYNLDVIISVGYRVKSKRGTAFRIWARNVLKQYLVKGYAVNERMRREQIGELRQLVGMLGRTIQNQPVLSTDESNALFEVVTDYTYALDTLDNYDYQRLTIQGTTHEEPFHATYENAMKEITYCGRNSAARCSLAMRRTTLLRAASGKSIRPSEAKNYIPA